MSYPLASPFILTGNFDILGVIDQLSMVYLWLSTERVLSTVDGI